MHFLLIARHYPPEISGGARRPSLYTKALRELGHRVTIVTPFEVDDKDSITVKNSTLLKGIAALHSSSKERPRSTVFSTIKNYLRPWLYWPDDNIQWVRDVTKTLKKMDLNPDWIMTTSPPESIHIAGHDLSQSTGIPWLAEFRDTWIEEPHRKILATSKLRVFTEKRIAKKTLRSAQAITAVSEAVMSEARKYVKPNTPECIIGHFSNPPPAPYDFDASKLNLVHTGGFTLSDRRRHLRPLLDILGMALPKRPNLTLHIAGPLTAEEQRLITEHAVTTIWHGSVDLTTARALQVGADGLILCTPENSHALPGKYAEYAQSGRPILHLGGGDWMSLVDDRSILRPLDSGVLTLQKGEKVKKQDGLNHIEAAQKLVAFASSAIAA